MQHSAHAQLRRVPLRSQMAAAHFPHTWPLLSSSSVGARHADAFPPKFPTRLARQCLTARNCSRYGICFGFCQRGASVTNDSVTEWLRRWTRNPLGSARKGSNPLGVALPQTLQTAARPSRSCNSPATPLATQACAHCVTVVICITQTRHACLLLPPSPHIDHACQAHRSAVV